MTLSGHAILHCIVCFQGKADMEFGNQLPLQIPNEEAAN